MKTFILMSVMLISSSTFARSTEKLIKECQQVGVEKLKSQAESFGLKLDMKTVRECGVDNRQLNPSAYVWFCAKTQNGEKEISVITQKSLFRDCF